MEVLVMNHQERQRMTICAMIKQRRITIVKGAKECQLSYRQMLRIYQKYSLEGDAGLIHGNRGRVSNRKHSSHQEIINIYLEKYEGFGPTLAAEYLLEDGYQVNHETLRKWLIKEGLWKRHRKRNFYRQRRERKSQFGELVQIDGSIHDWFGEGKHTCLLNMVDDATGTTLARMADGETTRVVFETLMAWIEKYGIPLALYVDLKNVYIGPKELSHLQMACDKLGIRIIKAYSPQAKGRVERNHAVYQDRFVKALKLKSITTIKEANQLLKNSFVDDLNQRFAKSPMNPKSAHRSLGKLKLIDILCWQYERVMNHDFTFTFQKHIYQIEKHPGDLIKPRITLNVRKHLDNTISAWYKDKELSIHIINKCEKEKVVYPRKNLFKNLKRLSWSKTNANFFK
jgi:transposase InsO family protein